MESQIFTATNKLYTICYDLDGLTCKLVYSGINHFIVTQACNGYVTFVDFDTLMYQECCY